MLVYLHLKFQPRFLHVFTVAEFWGESCPNSQIPEACKNFQIFLSYFKIHFLEFWKFISEVQIQSFQIYTMVSLGLENFQNKL